MLTELLSDPKVTMAVKDLFLQLPVLEIMTAAGRELGVDVRAIKTGGGSDGNHTSAIAPTLDGMGPKGNRAHSAEEYIEVATLLERTKMLALFLDRWAEEWHLPAS